ncbi:hypothetical protein L1987_15605 [Smallanthus sonchifolius]|uniref:Uncharacterized protein n=1 Tax=Smallanthus sonchifolius TaxID=185202 RepID=A0ACB9J868_9ASTR|nr:hypothetical protein L1987_15605 [Smallanthus sonchifolius]
MGSQQHMLSEEDVSSHNFQELYFLIDVHAQEMQECTDRLKTHLKHVGDDVLSHHIEELYFLIDVHAQEMQECTERLKTDLQHVVVEMQTRSQQVDAGEGSSQVLATTVQPQLLSCWNCKTLPATMVWYPCRHLCVCLECDTKISKCPMCNNLKQSSFMANLSA